MQIHLATCVSICISHAAIIKKCGACVPLTAAALSTYNIIYLSYNDDHIYSVKFWSLSDARDMSESSSDTSQENANITRILYWVHIVSSKLSSHSHFPNLGTVQGVPTFSWVKWRMKSWRESWRGLKWRIMMLWSNSS